MLRIVVVAYQNRDELGRLLDSLVRHVKVPFEVVVWDNGGSAPTVQKWLERNPHLRSQIHLDSRPRASKDMGSAVCNLGFGAGVNAALERATPQVWDCLLLLNPDATLESDLTPDILEQLKGCNGLVGLRVFDDAAQSIRQSSARSFPSFLTAWAGREGILTKIWPQNPWSKRYLGLRLNPEQLSRVDWVSGCALFTKRSVWEKLGGFDPRFFLYIEDVDLSRKAQSLGIPVYYNPCLNVVHAIGLSSGQRSLFSDFQHHKGMWLYFLKWTSPLGLLFSPLVFVGITLRFAARRILKNRLSLKQGAP